MTKNLREKVQMQWSMILTQHLWNLESQPSGKHSRCLMISSDFATSGVEEELFGAVSDVGIKIEKLRERKRK